MNIHFRNGSASGIQIVYARFEPSICAGNGDWLVVGWYDLDPGNEVFAFSTTGTTFFYYAEDSEGRGLRWEGQDKFANIIYQRFEHCINIVPPGSTSVGMRLYDTGQLVDDFTLTLD
jgi:hypothetical protein